MHKWLDRAAPVLTFISILAIWETLCRLLAVPSFLLPTPSAIVIAAFAVDIGQWWAHLAATLEVTLIGFVVSILVSVPIAITGGSVCVCGVTVTSTRPVVTADPSLRV